MDHPVEELHNAAAHLVATVFSRPAGSRHSRDRHQWIFLCRGKDIKSVLLFFSVGGQNLSPRPS